jgi:hypothetical protein
VEALGRKPLPVAARLFKRAVELDRQPEYVALAGIVRCEESKPNLDELTADAKFAVERAPNLAAGYTLEGMIRCLKAEAEKDYTDRIPVLREANDYFQKALSHKPGRWESILLHTKKSFTCIQLANFVTDKKSRSAYLTEVENQAAALRTLDADLVDAWDLAGCAEEDVAWLLHQMDKYPVAIESFTRAIGKFDARALPWMHRGRTRFKWAEALPVTDKTVGGLLDDAWSDLGDALKRAPDVMTEAEVHFWLARLSKLRAQVPGLPPQPGASSTPFEEAVKEFRTALTLVEKHGYDLWAETIVRFWAEAAVEEAERRTKAKDLKAAEARTVAKEAIGKFRRYTAPQAALLSLRLLDTEGPAGTSRERTEEVLRAYESALAEKARSQDRRTQFELYLRRADLRTSGKLFDQKTYPVEAAADAAQAVKLAEALDLPAADKARAYGQLGTARYLSYSVVSGSEKSATVQDAMKNLRTALALDPAHPNAWTWGYFFGVVVALNESSDGPDYEEAWRHLSAAAEPAARIGGPAWGVNVDKMRRLIQPRTESALEKALAKTAPGPDAWKMQLLLAEFYAPNSEKAQKARELAHQAEKGMPKDAGADYQKRLAKLLKDVG